jgi:hypothetical protein
MSVSHVRGLKDIYKLSEPFILTDGNFAIYLDVTRDCQTKRHSPTFQG